MAGSRTTPPLVEGVRNASDRPFAVTPVLRLYTSSPISFDAVTLLGVEYPMIEVYKIPLPKEKLAAIPEGERALLILLGYAANQLNFFSKLVIFSSNKDGNSEPEQTLSAAQTPMALRVVIGVLNEAWRLIHARFMGAPYAKEYTPLLSETGAQSFVRLKQELDAKDGLFSKLRGTWIFHYPDKTIDVTSAFQADL